jgi:hypothetical protein
MEINLSPTRGTFYSQLDNEINPFTTCQTTSMVMGLDIGKFGLNPIMQQAPDFRQTEDKLKIYMMSNPAVQDFWRRNHPGTSIPAPQWAGVMVFAINRLYEDQITYFDEFITLDEIAKDLHNGLPLYVSMAYPDNRNFNGRPNPISGHIVVVVGIDINDNIIINDPYKNHLTGGKDGFNNLYTKEQFLRHQRGHGIRYRRV